MNFIGNDDAVIMTNDDSSGCKRYAVSLGYYDDPYIKNFVKSTDRKPPEINRGYFARTLAIQILIEKFIDVNKGNCQVVSFGAGFDTLYWRLKSTNHVVQRYIELDFPSVTSRKCMYIQRRTSLIQAVTHEDYDIKLNRDSFHAHDYHLVGVDLRNLSEVETKLQQCDIDYNIPTVFLSECVLVYMPLNKSSTLLERISSLFKSAFFINYEMVNLGDRFGEVMLSNLRCRGCDLLGSEVCLSPETQTKRFLNNGWTGAECIDMLGLWSRLPPEEVSRVMQIELLDEQELLHQLFSHYCITTAWTDSRWSEIQL